MNRDNKRAQIKATFDFLGKCHQPNVSKIDKGIIDTAVWLMGIKGAIRTVPSDIVTKTQKAYPDMDSMAAHRKAAELWDKAIIIYNAKH